MSNDIRRMAELEAEVEALRHLASFVAKARAPDSYRDAKRARPNAPVAVIGGREALFIWTDHALEIDAVLSAYAARWAAS
jgi:alkylation response protein AidB-like acyl-CoA dehydrogenase